ncbi:hypothetical protein BLA29_000918 [Euroglyphus maynei]|uniref:Uncharacterized protein n=1 Tax=Euroglyphus maynei TaxID=6958 RepID=A0A1Y3BPH1_EURMA|nr:hypothetical protein BLA29_000918 [Euroglyphus maynei]
MSKEKHYIRTINGNLKQSEQSEKCFREKNVSTIIIIFISRLCGNRVKNFIKIENVTKVMNFGEGGC